MKKLNAIQSLVYLFLIIYFGLLILPDLPLSIWSMIDQNVQLDSLFLPIVNWIGQHVFQLKEPITILPSGSGDTTYNYVFEFFKIILSIFGAITWYFLDSQRTENQVFRYWVKTILRYYLATTMFTYGFSKVFYQQFSFPSLWQLDSPFGQSSPMGLAWKFIGYSQPYNVFLGSMEVLGGALLLFRRTTTLGALITLGVMTQVMVMNFCYDIPVKIFSTQLVLISLWLLSDDTVRLANLLFLNKPTEAVPFFEPFEKKIYNRIHLVLKYLVVGAVTILPLIEYVFPSNEDEMFEDEDTPLYGMYQVEKYVINKDTIAPLWTDSTRWNKLYFEYPETAMIRMTDNRVQNFEVEIDTIEKNISFQSRKDTTQIFEFKYHNLDNQRLMFCGMKGKDSICVLTNKVDVNKKYSLPGRGFHWINERPYNR